MPKHLRYLAIAATAEKEVRLLSGPHGDRQEAVDLLTEAFGDADPEHTAKLTLVVIPIEFEHVTLPKKPAPAPEPAPADPTDPDAGGGEGGTDPDPGETGGADPAKTVGNGDSNTGEG